MPVLFTDLTDKLLEYKNAGPKARQAILDAAIKSVSSLPATITDAKQAAKAYKTMAYASQIIKYSDNLRKIENQEPFEILFDFAGMGDLFTSGNPKFQEQFAPLAAFFKFGTKEEKNLGTMRLLKPHADIPPAIWKLFQDAQLVLMAPKGDKFKLTELDIFNPPANQLFPLPQFMGALKNKAVDRVCPNANGEFAVAKNFKGELQSAGGGMVEIDLVKSLDSHLHKALDEHLEEEHGELFKSAAAQYDELLESEFLAKITACINLEGKDKDGRPAPKLAELPQFVAFKARLDLVIQDALTHVGADEYTNAKVLNRLIDVIDNYPLEGSDNDQAMQKKLIHELKAMVQVETIKLHPLYEQAFKFMKDNAKMVEIDQVNDLRRGGGEQTAYTFLMTKPIEGFFASKGIHGNKLADDMTGGKYVRQTMLTLLSNFDKVRFSHIMTFLASQLDCLLNKTLDFATVWKNDQFNEAKGKIIAVGKEMCNLERASSKARGDELERKLVQLQEILKGSTISSKFKPQLEKLHDAILPLSKSGLENTEQLTTIVNKAIDLVTGEIAPKDYKKAALAIQQGKASKTMLAISAIMLALTAVAIALCAPVGAVVAATSACGFFAYGKQQGASLAANKLADIGLQPEAPRAK